MQDETYTACLVTKLMVSVAILDLPVIQGALLSTLLVQSKQGEKSQS